MADDTGRIPIDSLPPVERLARYKQLAEDTLRLAGHTYDAKIRTEYLELSAKWQARAARVEREIAQAATIPPKNDGDDQPER